MAALCVLGLALISGALDPLLDAVKSRLGGPWSTADSEVGSAGEQQGEAAGQGEARPKPAVLSESEVSRAEAAAKRRAAALEASQALDWNDTAVEAIQSGDFDLAIELLEKAGTAMPENAVYRANLAEAHVRRALAIPDQEPPGTFEEAEADYERALELLTDADRIEKVKALLDRARTIHREEAEFSVVETLHFTFKFDASRTEIRAGVDQLQTLLEDTYQEYGDLFGRRPVEAGEPKIAVVLYSSEGFNVVTGLGDWAGGAFDGKIRVPADDLRGAGRLARLRDVMRHEVAHAFAQSIGGARVPSWLNEGIAQWLENPERRTESLKVARARLANARDNGGKSLFALTEIQGSLATWTDKAEITRAYDQALAFTDYLVEQYGARLLFDLVAGCKAEGVGGAAAAFERALLVDIDVVLGDFAATL